MAKQVIFIFPIKRPKLALDILPYSVLDWFRHYLLKNKIIVTKGGR